MDPMISILVFRTLDGNNVILSDIDLNRQFGSIKKDLENKLNYSVKLILCGVLIPNNETPISLNVVKETVIIAVRYTQIQYAQA
jgi:hypothetical protein